MSDLYNSNSVPHSIPGGAVSWFDKDGGAKGVRTIEGFQPTRNVVKVMRPNQQGGPGGFALVEAEQATGSTTVQTPTTGASTAATALITAGDYFIMDFTTLGGAVEKWVASDCSEGYETAQYWKQTVALLKDHFYVPA